MMLRLEMNYALSRIICDFWWSNDMSTIGLLVIIVLGVNMELLTVMVVFEIYRL